jgi:hypothetical protein
VEKRIIISFFVFFALSLPLFSQVEENTRWYSLASGSSMDALLVVELLPAGSCRTWHSYLRKGESAPFEREMVEEMWYFDKAGERLFITDSWGEFASFSWDGQTPSLKSVIGKEEIVLTILNDKEWEELKDRFFPAGQ